MSTTGQDKSLAAYNLAADLETLRAAATQLAEAAAVAFTAARAIEHDAALIGDAKLTAKVRRMCDLINTDLRGNLLELPSLMTDVSVAREQL